MLEEQTEKITTESVALVKKSQILDDGGSSYKIENLPSDCTNDLLPEIEARVSEQDVLIRIHCEKMKGEVEKIVAEVEKKYLTVISCTIIAQMNPDFHISPKRTRDEPQISFQVIHMMRITGSLSGFLGTALWDMDFVEIRFLWDSRWSSSP
ncbi:hypothetical protein SAY87_001262 [Trapa incisa]|uniref:Uncharacterized protein n=1 Tax=Trapa incisa TaxID=236973 RepID=A0AAN7GDC6_9MYRT|nr:hypothetical protein SAY87_001262 [Trapa incisa]